jgi:hypothetical protein
MIIVIVLRGRKSSSDQVILGLNLSQFELQKPAIGGKQSQLFSGDGRPN